MLKSILVGLDGSADSQSATELGIRWARSQQALLIGLGIIDEPTITRASPVPLGAGAFKKQRDEALLADARKRVDEFLGRFALRCAEAGVACKLLEDVGLPWEQIVLEVQRFDLVLLGQHSQYHFETRQEDGTLRQVLLHSPRPVVVVPTQPPPNNSVLVAYDGSLQAARMLQALCGLNLLSYAGDVHVLSADADHVQAAKCADRAIEYLRFHGITAQSHVAGDATNAGEQILEQAERLQVGFVAMGCYGKPTLREMVFGSVTRRVLKESRVPLFLYH